MTTLIAHRGYSSKYPENTIAAFQAAYDAGFRNIELDVHVSGGGVPVVVHNHKLPDGRAVTGECVLPDTIPHLKDVSNWSASRGVTLFVDLKKESIAKHGREKVARLVSEACRGCLWVPVSFDIDVLRHFKGKTLHACDRRGDVVSIESVGGALREGTAVYTARTQSEIRLLHAIGARWVMVDDCGLAEGLPGEWLS